MGAKRHWNDWKIISPNKTFNVYVFEISIDVDFVNIEKCWNLKYSKYPNKSIRQGISKKHFQLKLDTYLYIQIHEEIFGDHSC